MTDDESFRTLAGPGEARRSVRGSAFVGHAAPVGSVEAAEAHLEAVRDAHPDATHHILAYRVRADPFREYASDAGEPSGSAGRPVLSVLQGRELQDVAVVVARYYGGTDLGVGGLARAYADAATGAVEAADVVERVPHETFEVAVEYDDSGTVRSILESAGVAFEATYEARVTFVVRAPVADADAVRDRLRSATSGRAELS